MKKILIWMFCIIFTISIVMMGIGCKAAEEEATEEEVTEEEVVEEEATEEEVVEEEATEEEPIKIVVWTHDHGPMVDQYNLLIPEYEAQNTNVTIEYKPFPWAEFETGLVTNFAAGTGPDIFGCWEQWTAKFADRNQLNEVDFASLGYDSMDSLKEDFVPNTLKIATSNDNVYGIPVEYNSYALYINTEHFEEIGLDASKDYPKTWNELIDIGKKLVIKDDDGNFTREGFDLLYLGPLISMYYMQPFFSQAGAEWFNSDMTECIINSPEGIKAMEVISSFVNEEQIGSPKSGNLNPTMGEQDFIDGQTSMMIAAPWLESVLAGQPIGDHYIVVPLPQMEDGQKEATLVYGWYWAVSEQSEIKEEAWEFIDFLSSNQLSWYENVNFIQPRHPEWMSTPEAEEIKTPYFDIFIDGFTIGETIPFVSFLPDLQNAANKAYESVLDDNADVDSTMDQLALEVNTILESQ